ncbi:hypothetical protein BDW71DRAFT_175793 [Aspergillus fruticulosus]
MKDGWDGWEAFLYMSSLCPGPRAQGPWPLSLACSHSLLRSRKGGVKLPEVIIICSARVQVTCHKTRHGAITDFSGLEVWGYSSVEPGCIVEKDRHGAIGCGCLCLPPVQAQSPDRGALSIPL